MDADVDVARWVLEFLLRRPETKDLAERFLAVLPISNNDLRLKKTLLLRSIEADVSDASISETILENLEILEELERNQEIEILDSMKMAYCAVALECTVKYLVSSGEKPGAKYVDAVKRIWKGRIGLMEKTGQSKLFTSVLKRTGDEVEAAVWDLGFVKKLVNMNTRNEAVRLALAYLHEAWALMGPSFIDFAASLRKQNGVLTSGSDGIGKRILSDGTLEKMTEKCRVELDVRPSDGVGVSERVVQDGTLEKRNEDCTVELHERPSDVFSKTVDLDGVVEERNEDFRTGLDLRPSDGMGDKFVLDAVGEERNEHCTVGLDARPTDGICEMVISVGNTERNEDFRAELDARPSDGVGERAILDGNLEKRNEDGTVELLGRPSDRVRKRVNSGGIVEERNEDCRTGLDLRPSNAVGDKVVLDAVGEERNEFCTVGLDVRATDAIGERVTLVGIAEERNEYCRVELDVRPTDGFEARDKDIVCSPNRSQYYSFKESVELTDKSTHIGGEQELVNGMTCNRMAGTTAVASDNESRDSVANASPVLIDKEIDGGNAVLQRKHGPSRKHPRPRGPPRISDPEDLSRDVQSGKFNYLPTPKVNKIQEALRSSSLELHEVVRDPLPDALRVAETVTLDLRSKSTSNEVLLENRNANEVNEQNLSHDKTNHSVRPSDANIGIPSCSQENNVPKPSLMERNNTACTYEWDDSIDESPERSKLHLPSPKRKAASPLKKYGSPKISMRRKFKRWTLLEEATLRSAIQKYGKGNWKLILNCHPDIFEERTEVDLKDKWRNMTRN